MVKFSKGMWALGPDVIINWAVEAIKSEAEQDKIRCVASTKHIGHRGDTLNMPTITLECSSPVPDILLLSAHHWKGQKSIVNGPHFEVFPGINVDELASKRTDNLQTLQTNSELKISTTTVSASIDIQPSSFTIDFTSHISKDPITGLPSDQLLTTLGWRSIGYVKHGTRSDHPNLFLEEPSAYGSRYMTLQFHLSVGEKIYGLGERFGPFIKNGQAVEMWNEDGGTSSELTYKNVPFYLSSRGYGIFVANPGRVSFEVQSERNTRVNIVVPHESMSIYLIHGPTPAAIIERYTLLTGRPALPPPWTFGLWLSTSFTTNYDEKTVTHFIDGMAERGIPLDVFHFDCFWMKRFQWCNFEFDSEFFPDPVGQLSRLKKKGLKICVWINPYIAQESKLFDEGFQNGYFLKTTDGSVWQSDTWQAGMAIVDFTNPNACQWYRSKLKALMEAGVDCFKTDFGERIPTANAVYHNGSDPNKMHNFYSLLYNQVVFEAVENYYGKNHGIVFARASTAGGQRFPVHWGGDPMSTFEAMAETLRGGLSLGLAGFSYWAHDIGGFEGNPDPALYKRWVAFGCLSSHTRLHGSGSFRVPWIVDESGEATQVLKKFIKLKLSLMPYLYTTAIQSHQTGIPMIRPMFIEFPDDPSAWMVDTQYMLGPNLLVAPVFNATGIVQYYIPEGDWVSILDGRIRSGPKFVTEKHDFMSMPILMRPGTCVATNASTDTTSATYDYSGDMLVLANFSGMAAGSVIEVSIPSCTQPGAIDAKLEITAFSERVKVVQGTPRGEWNVKVLAK